MSTQGRKKSSLFSQEGIFTPLPGKRAARYTAPVRRPGSLEVSGGDCPACWRQGIQADREGPGARLRVYLDLPNPLLYPADRLLLAPKMCDPAALSSPAPEDIEDCEERSAGLFLFPFHPLYGKTRRTLPESGRFPYDETVIRSRRLLVWELQLCPVRIQKVIERPMPLRMSLRTMGTLASSSRRAASSKSSSSMEKAT